jgi:hypothetical protein
MSFAGYPTGNGQYYSPASNAAAAPAATSSFWDNPLGTIFTDVEGFVSSMFGGASSFISGATGQADSYVQNSPTGNAVSLLSGVIPIMILLFFVALVIWFFKK